MWLLGPNLIKSPPLPIIWDMPKHLSQEFLRCTRPACVFSRHQGETASWQLAVENATANEHSCCGKWMSLPQVTSRFPPEHAKFNMEIGKIKSGRRFTLGYCRFGETTFKLLQISWAYPNQLWVDYSETGEQDQLWEVEYHRASISPRLIQTMPSPTGYCQTVHLAHYLPKRITLERDEQERNKSANRLASCRKAAPWGGHDSGTSLQLL